MEEETINFDLDGYFNAVSQSIDNTVEDTMKNLKPELYQYLKSRNSNHITEADLEESCNQFTERVKKHFEKNLAKFQLYSLRNVFTAPSSSLNADQSSNNLSSITNTPSSSSASALTSSATASSSEDSEEQELDRTLQRLRPYYVKLQKDYLQLSTECRDMDTLLKEMRSAMFNLRVALQSLEDYEISPLSETTYMGHQYQLKLQQCIQNAQEILQTIKQYIQNQESMKTSHKEEEMDTIKMDTTDSLQQLAKGFQG